MPLLCRLANKWNLIFSILVFGIAVLFSPETAFAASSGQSGWEQADNGEWRYLLSDRYPVCGGWIKDEDGWYYLDSNGIMATDTALEIEGHSYRFQADGAWIEDPASDPLFVHLPSGNLTTEKDRFTYEHSWANIRIPLPENTLIKTSEELRILSARDYIPSYYDFLAVIPDTAVLGVVIQYNSDSLEQILVDDHQVFSNFWGQYDLNPSDPQTVSMAGCTFERISCCLPAGLSMDVYLRNQDNKVLYLFIITPQDRQDAGKELAASIGRIY